MKLTAINELMLKRLLANAPTESSVDADYAGNWMTTRYLSYCLGERISFNFTLRLMPIPIIEVSIYDVENDEEWDLKAILKQYFHSQYQRIVGILTEWELDTAKRNFKHVMNLIIESIRTYHVPSFT